MKRKIVCDRTAYERAANRAPVWKALSLHTRDSWATAAERHSGAFDEPEDADAVSYGTRVARIYSGIFHSNRGQERDQENTPDTWLDLCKESDEKWEFELQRVLTTASADWISSSSHTMLESMLREYRDNIRLPLNGQPPAKVKPLEISLRPNSVPNRALQEIPHAETRIYEPIYGKYSEAWICCYRRECRMDPCPLIVPKKPAMYRLTIDYCLINAAKVPIFWPMPLIDAELNDVRGSKIFGNIDFCSRYWQLALATRCQHLLTFMIPRGVVKPARATQGIHNSGQNFQQVVAPCIFGNFWQAQVLAWGLFHVFWSWAVPSLHNGQIFKFLQATQSRHITTEKQFFAKSNQMVRPYYWWWRIPIHSD